MCILTYSELYLRLQPHYIMRATHLQTHLTTSVKQSEVFDLINSLIKRWSGYLQSANEYFREQKRRDLWIC